MAAEWYYRQGGQQIGPFSAGQVRELARAGTIVPHTLLRKGDDGNWIEAARIRGLFDGVPPEQAEAHAEKETVDPLLDLSKRAASSVASAAGSAASAIGDAVTNWFARQEETQGDAPRGPAAAPSQPGQAGPSWLEALSRDNQSPEVVALVANKVQGILMSGEEITYIAIQNKPIVNWMPDCIALTNKRIIFYRPKLLGRVDFQDYVWRELRDAQLSENVIGATFRIQTAAGEILSLDYLPRLQARALYRIAQEMEERSLEERRKRALEEQRATAGGVVVHTSPAPQPPAVPPRPVENTDLMDKLRQLKSMVDSGLISVAEYEGKKADILARM